MALPIKQPFLHSIVYIYDDAVLKIINYIDVLYHTVRPGSRACISFNLTFQTTILWICLQKYKNCLTLGLDHLGVGTTGKKLEAFHVKSMVLHGSCALHQKLLLYDFVYAVKIVL
jgi:hypothetical protein